ncbi:Flagellin [Pseudovibrio sp. Ad46]|uniref:flagellin N-terminal helical domain-containing protein n=1 Tax=unclassified Pseudovibrio TaxID=2627060 RepID=UPI0007AEA3DE|nr:MULTISPECIES: flagellin [unclassified Pseudovibrio]KZK86530.1 Flagellin [Pseudovibrio sp. Ad46]KZK91992.1 Flagellin [Pseudovibrio sp. Ad5]
MSSLLTNSSAMVALQTLKGINNNMAETQNRISTGMRVSDASDNAAYWSIATTMKSDNKALSAVQDALGLGAATVDVAFTAMDKAVDVVDEIKAKLTTAKDGTVDKGKIQADIKQLQEQLQTIASSANFSGENWLQQDKAADNLDKEIVGSFTRTADGQVEIQNIDVDTSSIVLVDTNTDAAANSGILSQQFGAIDGNNVDPADLVAANITVTGSTAGGDLAIAFTDGTVAYEGLEIDELEALVIAEAAASGTDPADGTAVAALLTGTLATAAGAIETKYTELAEDSLLTFDVGGLTDSVSDKAILNAIYERVDATLQTMTGAATDLGSAKARVDMQKQFASDLSDAIDRGIGQLVDADMNEESTRLKALQTQQQLGIQALSIANNASQNILSLFR